jgi:DNA-binding transcriptional LysR family regulator
MRFERLDLNLLVALDVLIEERSVSVAAKRLFLSQPALSGALNRLRDYFGDELLVQSGRQMILTPKAEQLRAPVREALILIRSRITTPLVFDPATADRQFSMVASDFVFNVLLADVFQEASRIAPKVKFELFLTDLHAPERLERGEIDLLITIAGYLVEGHPRRHLFRDEHAVVCWSGSKYSRGISEEEFWDAGHVITYFGPDKRAAFTETYFAQQGMSRRIEVRVPNFSLMPQALIGTDRITTMYRLHAEYFARFLPIAVLPPPVRLPFVSEEIQWHELRNDDAGLQWLLELVTRKADELTERQRSSPAFVKDL